MIKKTTFLIVILLICQLKLYASHQVNNDSVLEISKQNADKLYSGTEKYYGTDPDTLLYLAQLISEISDKLNYHTGKINAAYLRGNAYFDKNLFDQAASELYKGLELIKKNNSPVFYKKKVNILQLLGLTYEKTYNYSHSIDLYKRALIVANEIHDSTSIAQLNFNIGLSYFQLKKHAIASDFLNKALIYYNGLQSDYGVSRVYNTLGLIEKREKQWEKAIYHYQNAIDKIKSSSGPAKAEIWYISNIGECFFIQNKLDSAIYYYENAYQLSIKLKDKEKEIWLLNNLGDAYQKKGNYITAISYYHKSVELAKTDEQQQAIGSENQEVFDPEYERAVRNIAKAYQQMGEYEKALQYREMLAQAELLEQKSQYKVKEVGLMAENQFAQQKLDSIASEKSTFILAIIILFLSLTSLLLIAFVYYKGIHFIKKWRF